MRTRPSPEPTVRPAVRVRPAHPEEQEFIRHVCTVARLRTMRAPAVPVEEIAALAAMQVRAAERRRALAFPLAASYIVLDDEERVGRLLIDAAPDVLRVLDLALLPQWQGLGIGTTVMLGVCQLADERGVPIALDVPRDHHVVSFLRRLGFVEIDTTATSVSLRRPPPVIDLTEGSTGSEVDVSDSAATTSRRDVDASSA